VAFGISALVIEVVIYSVKELNSIFLERSEICPVLRFETYERRGMLLLSAIPTVGAGLLANTTGP
jgi:hypothetical protein